MIGFVSGGVFFLVLICRWIFCFSISVGNPIFHLSHAHVNLGFLMKQLRVMNTQSHYVSRAHISNQYCITLIQCGFIYHPSAFHCYGVFVLGSIAVVYTCFLNISICIVVVSGNRIYIFLYSTFCPWSRLRIFAQNHCSNLKCCNMQPLS